MKNREAWVLKKSKALKLSIELDMRTLILPLTIEGFVNACASAA